ncbi:MAG: hypothetical protein M3Z21_12435 [Pseudomonadota bacterium]|nr:hypothetical protein [Pseudomonadota bacterium]
MPKKRTTPPVSQLPYHELIKRERLLPSDAIRHFLGPDATPEEIKRVQNAVRYATQPDAKEKSRLVTSREGGVEYVEPKTFLRWAGGKWEDHWAGYCRRQGIGLGVLVKVSMDAVETLYVDDFAYGIPDDRKALEDMYVQAIEQLRNCRRENARLKRRIAELEKIAEEVRQAKERRRERGRENARKRNF